MKKVPEGENLNIEERKMMYQYNNHYIDQVIT